MNEVNIKNMPVGQLYEFAKNYYVWKIFRTNGTRAANYLTDSQIPTEYTEVFRKENDGQISNIWSGRLITNPGVFDEKGLNHTGSFSIFSYDQDTSASFHQDQELQIAPLGLQINALELEIEVLKYLSQQFEENQGKRL